MDSLMLEKPKVLFRDTEDGDFSTLRQYFDIISLSRLEQEPSLKGGIVAAVAIGPSAYKALSDALAILPSLKVIISVGAGTDHLTKHLEGFKKRGIHVFSCSEATSTPTADFTFALLLALARNLHKSIDSSSRQDWRSFPDSVRVGGATIGIVGMGRIGFKVAQRAIGFNMTVLYHNRNRRNEAELSTGQLKYYRDLNEMVPLCDFLVICCSLTSQTHHMINKDVLSLMKSSAILVNTSRGAVVDTDALVEALASGRIHGAALDVTDPEPLPDGHPLLMTDNALVTVHCGFADNRTMDDQLTGAFTILKASLIDNEEIPQNQKLC